MLCSMLAVKRPRDMLLAAVRAAGFSQLLLNTIHLIKTSPGQHAQRERA
jgi:hypothetical protein